MTTTAGPRLWVSSEVFADFPKYCRGVVVAYGIENGESPAPLAEQLRLEQERIRTHLNDVDLNTVERLASWREAFKIAGIKPTKFRPSIDGLVRRVVQGSPLPLINCLVDLGNLYSLRYLTPIGGHAIDGLLEGMALRKALGSEIFTPFGEQQVENPEPGEIIFVDADQVMTRRWVWRQANHTLVQTSTRAIEINVDGLDPVQPDEIREICTRLAEDVVRLCGGKARFDILTAQMPEMSLAQFG